MSGGNLERTWGLSARGRLGSELVRGDFAEKNLGSEHCEVREGHWRMSWRFP